MKKFLVSAVLAVTSLAASAGLPAGIFDHVGVGLGVGTTGIQIEAATPITRWVQMRAGVAIMPGIKFNTEVDGYYYHSGTEYDTTVDLSASLGRTQGLIIFNVYPIPTVPFYVAAGAYFGGSSLIKITGYSPELEKYGGTVQVGDYEIDVPDGYVKGGLKVSGFRPYLGIGWGRAVPGKLINFSMDLGVQFHGTPKLYSNNGDIDLSEVTDDDTIQKIINKVTVYPTLTFRLGFRAY